MANLSSPKIPAGHPVFAAPDSAGSIDLTLLSSDSVHFHVHKRYLATSSLCFDTMLLHNIMPRSATHESIALVNMEESALVLNVLLHHCYPACSFPMAKLEFRELLDCLRGADKLELPRAVSNITSAFLSRSILNPHEALELYQHAYRYNIPELAAHALNNDLLPTWSQVGQARKWDPVMGFEGATRLMEAFARRRTLGRLQFIKCAQELMEEEARLQDNPDNPGIQEYQGSASMWKMYHLAYGILQKDWDF